MIKSSSLLHYNVVETFIKIKEVALKPWNVEEYWSENKSKNSISHWLKNLSDREFKSVTKEIELLKLYGNLLQMPHSKSLGKGIFELRERKNGLRIYYCFRPNQIIILLIAGNKASQKKDIEIARKRYLDISK